MKSSTIVISLLASVATAQPFGHFGHGHGHQKRGHVHAHPHKRDLVTEWVTETVYETAAPVAPAAPAAPSSPPAAVAGTSTSGGYTGDLTYYTLGMGACGFDDAGKDTSDYIVALSHIVMGLQSNGNPMCNKKVAVSYGGKTLTATCRDKCMGCEADAIDGSEKLFVDLFGSLGVGRGKVQWKFLD
ncbi:hypothetical protein B0T26DRAFT_636985 [Lasiosphaeria miniovina]|uniref:Allergen Asp f 7 n=1 Tax=Lasiosphaeria miniovina TaxID=1954250 RepID=A0AA40E885_9PEZI|nr:uncharacterized protein B0T26DRAFT_636985 [Lasiosphaeria miniovina]KAK0728692.1 hypothetical protein B0T26DRAFT_636985 [Lasiosphaeria miniovina]